GPFGANTLFGIQAPPIPVVRTFLALEQTRTGQWLIAATRRLRNGSNTAEWGGIKMFLESRISPNDPKKERVYANFRRNLEDIVNVGVRHHVPILLSSVASNLKDFPPLASQNVPTLNS